MSATTPLRTSAHAGRAARRRKPVPRVASRHSRVASVGTRTDDPVLASRVRRTGASVAGRAAPAAARTAMATMPARARNVRDTFHGIAAPPWRDRGLEIVPMARSVLRLRLVGQVRRPGGAVDVTPAVDEQRVAGDVPTVVAGEEQRDRRDVL